jgi:hypothetical protein
MAEQLPQIHQEASVNSASRIRNNTTTWLAETLNGSMYTDFELTFDGDELYGQEGEPLRNIFDDSIRDARLIVNKNPSLLFELRRRLIERGELEDIESMVRGEMYTDDGEKVNTLVVVSDFPAELMGKSVDVGGYNVNRKQTMLRVISVDRQGIINLTTQSLDGSNRPALEDIYKATGKKSRPGELLEQRIELSIPDKWQPNLATNLKKVYDRSLTVQYGDEWSAGIRKNKERLEIDTYKFACAQHDLIDLFTVQKLENPMAAEKLRYSLAATAQARYERAIKKSNKIGTLTPGLFSLDEVISYEAIAGGQRLMQEITREGRRAAARGESFSGCGSTVNAEDNLTIEGQLGFTGYGNKSGEDRYGSLNFKCTKGHSNTRPRNKLISNCTTCGESVKCK